MSIIKVKKIYIFCAVLFCIFLSIDVYAGALLPDGIAIQNNYKAGTQSVVGKVSDIAGKVIIIHSDNSKTGYKAAAGVNIYKKDTIISQTDGSIRFELNDGSTVSLASETKLVINESVYRAKEKVRSSFLTMLIGKAHFIVQKLPGYNKSGFKVKTKTAIVGVRGSKFIVESQVATKVTTLEDTNLWVENIMFPDQGIKVGSFMQTIIEQGMLPSTPEPVSPDEVEQIIQDSFPAAPKIDKISLKHEKDETSGKTGQGEINKPGIEPEIEIEEIQIDIEEPEIELDMENIVNDVVENIEDMIQDDIPSDVTTDETPPYIPDQEISGGSGTGGP